MGVVISHLALFLSLFNHQPPQPHHVFSQLCMPEITCDAIGRCVLKPCPSVAILCATQKNKKFLHQDQELNHWYKDITSCSIENFGNRIVGSCEFKSVPDNIKTIAKKVQKKLQKHAIYIAKRDSTTCKQRLVELCKQEQQRRPAKEKRNSCAFKRHCFQPKKNARK